MSANQGRLQRIRGRNGQSMRAAYLSAHPLCVHCESKGIVRAATEVDHVTAFANGGSDTWDNKQSLCKPCHRVKTNDDLGYRQRRGCGVDGYPEGGKNLWG